MATSLISDQNVRTFQSAISLPRLHQTGLLPFFEQVIFDVILLKERENPFLVEIAGIDQQFLFVI